MLKGEWGGGNKENNGSERSYLPTSNAGEASGDTSVVMVNMPSNFRSGDGAVILAEARTRTLIGEKSIIFSKCADIRVELIPLLPSSSEIDVYLVFPNWTSAAP